MSGGSIHHMVSSLKRNKALLKARGKKRTLSIVDESNRKPRKPIVNPIRSRINFLNESRQDHQSQKIVLLLALIIVLAIIIAIFIT